MSADRLKLRIELFVADIAKSKSFYIDVLEFTAGPEGFGGYTPLSKNDISLSLNGNHALPKDHPTKVTESDRAGRGVEIVIEVEDVNVAYRSVKASGRPISGDLATHPWGLTDFRVIDPDGYYLRISSAA